MEKPRNISDFGLTPELVAFIKSQEGWVAKPYLCPAGFPTIGYGHRIPSMDHLTIDKATGEALLRVDLRGSRDTVVALSPNVLREPERRAAALTDFVFNLGGSRYRGSTLRRRVRERDWPAAGKEMRRWVYAAGRVMRALVRRRDIASRWLET